MKQIVKKLSWKVDLAIYRLFYWRWSPRLKRDPNLAYIFSKIGAAWTNGHPPNDPLLLDKFILERFREAGKQPIVNAGSEQKTWLEIR